MIKKPFLILYYPGARGDFLASVLTDTLIMSGIWIASTPLTKLYTKAHYSNRYHLQLNPTCSLNDIMSMLSIRIYLETFSDMLTTAYYCYEKIEPETRLYTKIVSTIISHEIFHRQLSRYFNYNLRFDELFNPEFLKLFYEHNTGGLMSNDRYNNIVKNINLNPVVTLNNYKDYLDISDSDMQLLKEKYEQTFGISAY